LLTIVMLMMTRIRIPDGGVSCQRHGSIFSTFGSLRKGV
jgi:hypothetical protein